MIKNFNNQLLICGIFIALVFTACKPTAEIYDGPVLKILNVSELTFDSLSSAYKISVKFNVSTNDGLPILKRGVYWNTNPNPTESSDKVIDSISGVGDFTCTLSNLQPGITYYGRACVVNSEEDVYSEVFVFTTPFDVNLPNNILNTTLSYDSIFDDEGNMYKTITIYKTIKQYDALNDVYLEVKLDSVTWMAENLRATKFSSGEAIPNITDNTAWNTLTTPAYCAYNNGNELNTIKKFGRLYNYYAASDAKNIAPKGWHVATDADFTKLVSILSEDTAIAYKVITYVNDSLNDTLTVRRKDIVAQSLAVTCYDNPTYSQILNWIPSSIPYTTSNVSFDPMLGSSFESQNLTGFSALPA